MFLPGKLQSTTLGDIIGRLHRAKVTGVLELVSHDFPHAGARHSIRLRSGVVEEVCTPVPVPRLGEVLLSQGALSADQHGRFEREIARARDIRSGDLLVEHQMVSSAAVLAALAGQQRLRLDALYGLRRADLRFHPGRPASEEASQGFAHSGERSADTEPIRLEPSQFLHGRPRARERISPSGAQHAGDTQHPTSRSEALRLLGVADGASRAEIRTAFRRMAGLAHPDLFPHASAAERVALHARFVRLSTAYHSLTCPDRAAT